MHKLWPPAVLALLACGGDSHGVTPPSVGTSTVTLRLTPSSASQVPIGVESAIVKVFSATTDVVQPVAIPAPGTTSTYTLTGPDTIQSGTPATG